MAKINRKAIYEITNGRCVYCGCKLDFYNFHCDHILPKSKGGKDAGNLIPSCPDCNNIKSNMSIEQFRKTLEGFPYSSIKCRAICKYLGVKRKKVTFYFEKIGMEI